MRNLFLTIALAWMSLSPAQASLFYLNDDEVLDSGSGYVWLDTKLTVGMTFDNIYTQNGWRVAEGNEEPPYLGGAPAESPLRLFESNFPGMLYVEGLPYNSEVFELIDFLGVRNQFNEPEILADHWANTYSSPDGVVERDWMVTYVTYSGTGETLRLFLDQEGYTGPFTNPAGNGLWLLRDATPAELAAVPIPASIWLLGTACVGLIGRTRRSMALAFSNSK